MTLEELNEVHKVLFEQYQEAKKANIELEGRLRVALATLAMMDMSAMQAELDRRKDEQAKLQVQYDMLKTHHAVCDAWLKDYKTIKAKHDTVVKERDNLKVDLKASQAVVNRQDNNYRDLQDKHADLGNTLVVLEHALNDWSLELGGTGENTVDYLKDLVQGRLNLLVEALEAERKEVATLRAKLAN